MKRRIIKQRDSYTITLPISWVRSNNIEKNDEIEVAERENLLTLSAEKAEKLKKLELDATSADFNNIYLAYCYRAGYDELRIKFSTSDAFDKIKDRTSRLIGYEIIEQKADSCLVKSVSAPLSSEFDSFFRRLFLTTLEMGDSLLSSLKNKNWERLKEIRSIERTNNAFYEFICRILQKEERKNITIFLYNINRDIERICDSYKYITDYLLGSRKITISRETLNYFDKVNRYLRDFYELFYKFDRNKLDKISTQRYELVKQGNKIYDKASHKEGLIIFNLINIVQMVFDLAGPVYCMNLEKT